MKNNRVDIYRLVSTLIEATEKGLCQWIDRKDASFLLSLKNGSILLRSIYDTMTDYTSYDIKLSDDTECFATFQAEGFDELYSLLNDLWKAVINEQQRIMEEKMYKLYTDLRILENK